MKKTLLLFLLGVLSGCAAGFDSTLPMDNILVVEDPNPERVQFGERWVRVDTFADLREKETLITVNNKRTIQPKDGVSRYVTEAFQDILRIKDFRLSQKRGPLIRAEILEWKADLETGFPYSTENANASVRLMVVDETGKLRFSTVYNGSSSLKHPFLTESKATALLGEAMMAALEAALEDQAFTKMLDDLRQGLR